MNVRLRGIYTTALTARLQKTEWTVVQPSPTMAARMDRAASYEPAAATIDMTPDRRGISVSGDPAAVESLAETIEEIGDDTLCWPDPIPLGGIVDGVVDRTQGSGAILSLPGDMEGYLPFDAVDGYVDIGDSYRVQVTAPRPPWDDRAPRVEPDITVPLPMVTLVRGTSGTEAATDDAAGAELVRSMELLSTAPPEGWGVRWERTATEASIDAREQALERAVEYAETIETALADASDPTGAPAVISRPFGTRWLWFGRESRFELDQYRRELVTTMAGHHRIKAGTDRASAAVDFVEAVCDGPTETMPIDTVLDQFGPQEGATVGISHGKPDGRRYDLGPATVTDREADGTIRLQREIKGSGTYDALGTDRSPGDIALTKIVEGREWYPTVYRGTDGTSKGTYINICTPLEIFPEEVHYVDLHIDVIKRPDGTVEIVDADELAAAVDDEMVSPALADRARAVAERVKKALSE